MNLFVLLACSEPVELRTLSFSYLEADEITNIEALSIPYTDSSQATFRTVNSYGVAISSTEPINFYVEGEDIPREVMTDAFGYARAELLPSEGYRLSVDNELMYPIVQSQNQALSLPQLMPLSEVPSMVEVGTEGFFLAFGESLHWQSVLMGSTSYSVLNAGAEIQGLWSRHIDRDGILDAVVWTDNSVFLLRGVPNGGLSWGAGFSFEDRVVSVSVSDLNGDLIPDLAVGVTSELDSIVAIFHSDGDWSFVEAEHMLQPYPLESMVAEDEDRDGRADISLIDENTGYVRRYSYAPAGWAGGLPSIIEPDQYIAPKGSHMPPMIDLNADGRNDLVIIGSEVSNTQDLVFFIIQQSFVIFRQQYTPFLAHYADVDQNGSQDIVTFTEEGIRYLWFSTETGEFTANTFSGFGEKRPFAVIDGDNDGISDVAFFDQNIVIHPGTKTPENTWKLAATIWTSYDNRFTQDFFIDDFDEDGLVEIVGFILTGSEVKLEASELTTSEEGNVLTSVDVYPFPGDASEGLDLAQCGNDIVSLIRRSEGGGDFVYDLRLFNVVNNDLSRRASRPVDEQLRMDCTRANDQTYIVVGTGTDWMLLRHTMEEIGSGSSEDWVDITVGDVDGVGALDIRGCSTAGCSIDFVDFDGDGIDELVTNEGDISVEGWGMSFVLQHQGEHRIEDIDGDGVDEILVFNAEGLWVYRATTGQILSPFGLQLNTDAVGVAQFADLDGDGVLSPVVMRENGQLAHPAR